MPLQAKSGASKERGGVKAGREGSVQMKAALTLLAQTAASDSQQVAHATGSRLPPSPSLRGVGEDDGAAAAKEEEEEMERVKRELREARVEVVGLRLRVGAAEIEARQARGQKTEVETALKRVEEEVQRLGQELRESVVARGQMEWHVVRGHVAAPVGTDLAHVTGLCRCLVFSCLSRLYACFRSSLRASSACLLSPLRFPSVPAYPLLSSPLLPSHSHDCDAICMCRC
eukprot:2064433-Rhodomonas_salina.2